MNGRTYIQYVQPDIFNTALAKSITAYENTSVALRFRAVQAKEQGAENRA